MRATYRRAFLFGGLALMVWGCTPATSQSPSVQESASASEEVTGLPPGCQPIELRDPNGERIELDGRWTVVRSPPSGPLMTWWLFTQGDCVWGAGQVDDVGAISTSPNPDKVQSLSGHIGSDFTITGDILWLGPPPPAMPFQLVRYSPLEMFIEFGDSGAVLLREDREGGVQGPRCPFPPNYCPPPLVLERAD